MAQNWKKKKFLPEKKLPFLSLLAIVIIVMPGWNLKTDLLRPVKQPEKTSEKIRGKVFLDEDRNGRPDRGEKGLRGVSVSDGLNVTISDESGNYILDSDYSSGIVWITPPSNHSPSGSFWHNKEGRNNIDFGLISQLQSEDFVFVQISDAHVGRAEKLKQLGQTLNSLPVKIDFVVETGDLVAATDVVLPDEAPKQFESALEAMKSFRQPVFHLPGNHEHVSHNVKEADTTHPNYGKGLYRKLLGPTYYSWDWAGIHFIALDGTSLPYREQLGNTQLKWLHKDLNLQKEDKPIILFCHQPINNLRDAGELEQILSGRNILGAFCGHIHKNYTEQFLDFNIFISGAVSGTWWGGPNTDGTPQGYRIVQVKDGEIRTVYANMDGLNPISLVSPFADAVLSGLVEFEISVVDFGKTCQVRGMFENRPVVMRQTSRTELWSFWKGVFNSRNTSDGGRLLNIAAIGSNDTSKLEVRYLLDNNNNEPFISDAAATLNIQVNRSSDEVMVQLNGEFMGTIPSGTANGKIATFNIPGQKLQRLNKLILRIPENSKETHNLGPVFIDYREKKLYDQRYPTFNRYNLGNGKGLRGEKNLYYVIP